MDDDDEFSAEEIAELKRRLDHSRLVQAYGTKMWCGLCTKYEGKREHTAISCLVHWRIPWWIRMHMPETIWSFSQRVRERLRTLRNSR